MKTGKIRHSSTGGFAFNPTTIMGCVLFTALPYSQLNAQENVWSGLARSQFDSAALTLRIPCVVLEDEMGNSLPGFSPAFALNLLFVGDDEANQIFRLQEPLQEFTEIPNSCLDTLTVSNDGSTATYSTNSIEVDVDAAVFSNRYYTLELQANLGGQGPIDFSILSAESRIYKAPRFSGETFLIFVPAAPFLADFIYDEVLINSSVQQVYADLSVFEPSFIDVSCFYFDPLGLLELVDVVNGNSRYRLNPSVTSANNNTSFTMRCSVVNRDLNHHADDVDILTWFIQI